MTEEALYEMYRLLAIAKYDERYVIPSGYAEPPTSGARRRSRAARSTSTADRGCT